VVPDHQKELARLADEATAKAAAETGTSSDAEEAVSKPKKRKQKTVA
jgi:hypothetical protein